MNNLKAPLTAVVDDMMPITQPPLAAVTARVRIRRRRRIALLTTAGFIVLVGAPLAALLTTSSTTDPDPSAPSPPASLATSAPTNQDQLVGEVPLVATVACARGDTHSPEQVLNAQFALDGIVTKIEPPPTESSFGGPIVTVSVQEWFRGGTAPSVRVQMWPAAKVDGSRSYDIGFRLLISGDHGPGRLITGWPCGATRYFDPATAERWRDLTH